MDSTEDSNNKAVSKNTPKIIKILSSKSKTQSKSEESSNQGSNLNSDEKES